MRKKKLCLRRLLPVIAALLVFVMFRTVFILGYVSTNSMKPTLEAGSLILGVRIKRSFEVGDIVIFYHGGNLFVKRIAAVGGDVVMHNGINMSAPEGSYYMLGENADNSYDSRYWNAPFVPETTFVAKVWLPIGGDSRGAIKRLGWPRDDGCQFFQTMPFNKTIGIKKIGEFQRFTKIFCVVLH